MRRIISPEESQHLQSLVIRNGLDECRSDLLGGLPPGFRASLPGLAEPYLQVISDLNVLNASGTLASGDDPLLVWAAHCISLLPLGSDRDYVDKLYQRLVNMGLRAPCLTARKFPVPEGKQTCIDCGRLEPSTFNFCPSCGAPFPLRILTR